MITTLRTFSALTLAIFSTVLSADVADSSLQSPGLVLSRGFCPGGVYPDTVWPGGRRPEGVSTWGSFCVNGNNDVGNLESQEFVAPSALNLYLAGYPGLPGRHLLLKNAQSGEEIEIRPRTMPGEVWQLNNLPVPPTWIGKPVRLTAEDSVTGPGGWFGFSLPMVPASSLLPAIDTNRPQDGFCSNGVYHTTKWPDNLRPPALATWGSHCKSGDADMGWKASQAVIAGSYLSVYIAGYPSTPGILLAAENVQTGQQVLLQPLASPNEESIFSPGEAWRLYHFRLPAAWKGQSVRLLASDKTREMFGWIGFSEPIPENLLAETFSAAKTLGLVLFLALTILLPAVAGCMLMALCGVEDLLDLTATALLAVGLTGYAAFWIYFCSPSLGILFSYAGLLGSCAFVVYASVAPNRRSRLWPLKQLIAPGALVVLAAIFVMSLGLLHGGERAPVSMAAGRFGPPVLHADNEIPKWFADGVYAGKIPRPLMADFLSSDRPPLQTGNTLWVYAWTFGNRNLPYLALSVILQCSFLAALWSFLIACNIDRRPLVLALATSFLSGFTLLNGFFTWPKLFPVAFLLIVAAYLLTDRFARVRDQAAIGMLIGATAAFAMLCHGGSIFALLGMCAFLLTVHRYPSRRFLIGMAITAALLYSPWTLYQKLYDPPGDRLLKWHVGGTVNPVPNESFTHVLFSNYAKLKVSEVIQLKASNFNALGGDIGQYLEEMGVFGAALAASPVNTRDNAASSIRRIMFFSWIPAIGLAILGPLALLFSSLSRRRPRGVEFIAAARMWWLTGLTLAIWCLLMFGPGTTNPHQGVYLTEILAFAGSCLAFWAVRPWLAVAATAAQILWNAALFVWLTPAALPGVGSSLLGPVDSVQGAVCLLSTAAIFALLASFARRPPVSSAAGHQSNELNRGDVCVFDSKVSWKRLAYRPRKEGPHELLR